MLSSLLIAALLAPAAAAKHTLRGKAAQREEVPAPAPQPTQKHPSPAPTPVRPTLEPTAVPTTAYADGRCCLWSDDAGWPADSCAPCTVLAHPGSYCGQSEKQCEKCLNYGGRGLDAVWCQPGRPEPTAEPTALPTAEPTFKPTTSAEPTTEPTVVQTAKPTLVEETKPPTAKPTVAPSSKPTFKETVEPTMKETASPSVKPSAKPTNVDDTFPPTVKPTVAPSAEPTFKTTATPAPTEEATDKPTPGDDETPAPTVWAPTAEPTVETVGGICCLWSSSSQWSIDACAPCDVPAAPGTCGAGVARTSGFVGYCAESAEQCAKCKNSAWCPSGTPETKAPTMTPKPTAVETPKPTTDGSVTSGTCCLWSSSSAWGTDSCAPCDDVAPAGHYCALGAAECANCKNAVWCGDSNATPKPTGTVTPKPTSVDETPKPTPSTPSTGTCCLWSSSSMWGIDNCAACDDMAPPDHYCAQGRAECANCKNAVWCSGGAPQNPTPTPAPVPQTPEPTPSVGGGGGGGKCCFFSATVPENVCAACDDAAAPDHHCASKVNCEADCGIGKWCGE